MKRKILKRKTEFDFDNFTSHDNESFHITLVRTPAVSTSSSISISSIAPSLALAYLSGTLRKCKFSVTNIDSIGEGISNISPIPHIPGMIFQGIPAEEIIRRIPKNTNLIGVSCMFSSEWVYTRHIINLIRNEFASIPIIAGGEHATAIPEFILEDCPAIDVVVLGEGEATLVELVYAIHNHQEVGNIKGLVIREKSEFVKTGYRKRITNINDIQWPAWDMLPIDNYLSLGLSHGPYRGKTMPIMASRGCPYQCTFCSNPTMWTTLWSPRDVEDVVREIQYYKEKYGATSIEFYDLTTIINKKWILQFCDLLIKEKVNIIWQISGGTRTEAVDEQVIQKLVKSGCKYLGFAPESGSREVLKEIKKKVDLDRMVSLFRISKKYDLDTRSNFVIGFPNDTRRKIYATLLFQMKLAFIGVIDSPIFIFTPYPGSELFHFLKDKGIIQEYDDNYFNSLGLDLKIKSGNGYCLHVRPTELFVYQILGMIMFYGVYYLIHPLRLFRFIKSLVLGGETSSVFEQRVIANVKKRFGRYRLNDHKPLGNSDVSLARRKLADIRHGAREL